MKIYQKIFFAATARLSIPVLLAFGLTFCAAAQETNDNLSAIQASAAKGDARAQCQLAALYANGTGGVTRDYAKAAQYAKLSAAQGYAPAEILLGSFYGQSRGVLRNLKTAVAWYRKAADQGNALAEYAMGNFYSTGRGVTNDVRQAIAWWQKAAAQNQVEAEAALGQIHLVTTPTNGTNYLNYTEALRWLRPAAAHDYPPALNNLGVAYENGLGVKSDFAEAAHWYREAAERGDAAGQANLAQLYFDGRGVPFDLVQAYKWFKLSSFQRNTLGVAGFGNFESHQLLTPQQLEQAEELVQNFKPKQDPKQL